MKLRHLWIILTVVGVLAGAGESAALAGSKDLPKVKTKKVSYGKKNMILCFPPEEREPEFKDKPFILFIHGGAWTPGGGSRDTFMPHCKYVAGLGYAAATMSYRLAPVHPYPAAPNDVKQAIQWLHDHVGEHSTDKVKLNAETVLLVGHSAGGHLALLVGLQEKDLPVAGIVSLSGPTDLTKSGSCKPCPVDRRMFLGTHKAEVASPITYVRADAPPIRLVHGDSDAVVNTEQSLDLAAALEELGATVQLEIIEGGGHWAAVKSEKTPDVVDEVMDYILEYADR